MHSASGSPLENGDLVTHAARLVIGDLTVRFVTSCEPAHQYLQRLDNLAGIRPFQWLNDDPHLPMLTVHYREDTQRSATFDPVARRFEVMFPWEDEAPELFVTGRPHRNLLLYPIRLAVEWLRQEQGQYTVHASAVTRNGQAVVFAGDAEAGKTTMALDLCHNLGFSIYANDQTVLSTRDGRPWLMYGDRLISLRLSSVARYSAAIADTMFTDGQVTEAWDIKRDVAAHELGIGATSDPVPLKLFVKIRLDDRLDDCVVHVMSRRTMDDTPDRERRALFHTKVELYREITQVIRGAAFTPLRDVDLSLLDMFLPSLDEPRFLANRTKFMNALFNDDHMAVVSVRGPLDACSRAVVRLFESPAYEAALLDRGDPERVG
jgi:hypothetical protein